MKVPILRYHKTYSYYFSKPKHYLDQEEASLLRNLHFAGLVRGSRN